MFLRWLFTGIVGLVLFFDPSWAQAKTVAVFGRTFELVDNAQLQYYGGAEGDRILQGILAQDHRLVIGGHTFVFKAQTKITFYSTGRLKEGFLKSPAQVTVAGHRLTMAWRIGFSPIEQVEWGSFAQPATFSIGLNQVTFIAGQYWTTEFYPSGRVKRGYLKDTNHLKVDQYLIPFQSNIEFSKKGLVTRGVLGRDVVIKDQRFSMGRAVSFIYNAAGQLTSVSNYQYPQR